MSEQQLDLFGEDLPAAAAEQLASEPGQWPEKLAEIVDILWDELAKALPGCSGDDARQVAMRLGVRLTQEYGGANLYIPKEDSIRRALRDLAVWADYDGTVDGPRGIRGLARQYALSDVSVWEILRRQRKLHRERIQPDLFRTLESQERP